MSRIEVPNLQDLIPDEVKCSWCNNNRNKVHNKSDVLESSLNHRPRRPLFSTKVVLGAVKVGDCWSGGYMGMSYTKMQTTQVWGERGRKEPPTCALLSGKFPLGFGRMRHVREWREDRGILLGRAFPDCLHPVDERIPCKSCTSVAPPQALCWLLFTASQALSHLVKCHPWCGDGVIPCPEATGNLFRKDTGPCTTSRGLLSLNFKWLALASGLRGRMKWSGWKSSATGLAQLRGNLKFEVAAGHL